MANATVICSLGHRLHTFIAKIKSALHPSEVAKSSTSFGWGKGRNVTSARWRVTLCHLIWHVSSHSGVAMLHCEMLYLYTLLYFSLLSLDVQDSLM